MAVDIKVSSAGGLLAGVPHKLFDVSADEWDVSQDGQHFLVNLRAPSSPAARGVGPIRVILNWVPTGKQ
jgi:hypothetical protein